MTNDYTGCGEIPLVAGEITGYRAWRVALAIPVLYSCTRPINAWFPGINVAICINGENTRRLDCHTSAAPSRSCTCGFYARTEDDKHGFSNGIQGVVRSSGRIILGDRGYRAEKSRIVALYRTEISDDFFMNSTTSAMWASNFPKALDVLSGVYKVPVLESKDEAWERFPPDDLSSFRRQPVPEEPSIVIRNATGQIVFDNSSRLITGSITITPYTL